MNKNMIETTGKELYHNDLNTQLLLGVAAIALGQALQNGNGFLTRLALLWLTIALICSCKSIFSQRLPFPVSKLTLWIILTAGLVLQIFQLLTTIPGWYILPASLEKLWQYRVCIFFGGISALLSLSPQSWFHPLVRRVLIALVFIAMLVAGIWVIRALPSPYIDVYMFHQTSSAALLQSDNPYELSEPNFYENMNLYGPELVKNGRMTIGNPYPPLSIYLSSIGYFVAGDIRYSHLAAIILGAILMVCLRPDRGALFGAYIFLFTPRVYLVLEQSWTEPLVLLLAVAVIWCAIHRPGWRFIALGLLIASKQYMILLSPLIVLLIPHNSSRQVWAKAIGWTIGTAFVVTAPLAFLNFPAFFWNVGQSQFYQIFRLDSLSYAAVYAIISGRLPSQYISFGILVIVLFLVWRYGQRSPSGYAAAMAFCLGIFFAFSKQAFCNYYFLVIGLLSAAIAAIPTLDISETQNPT
jgi:hypothetical protein